MFEIMEEASLLTSNLYCSSSFFETLSSDGLSDKLSVDKVENPCSEVEISVWNVFSAFNVGCRLDLKMIAMKTPNVVYSSSRKTLTMKIRHPEASAVVRPSGKITCAGTKSKEEAHKASRRFARIIQKFGYNCKFRDFNISNIAATCKLPFSISGYEFAMKYKDLVSYEPEMSVGVIYKMNNPNVTMRIHSSGYINLCGKNIEDLHSAVRHAFPKLYEFRLPKLPKSIHEVIHTINPFHREKYEESDDSD